MEDAMQILRNRRNAKAVPHLEQYAPVWMVDEILLPKDDAIQFNVAFQHPIYGWVNRRYRYDGFNDVLYHRGQVTLTEEDAVGIQGTDPFITLTVSDIPNSYGG